jgi:3-oxoacyl-[acyl-carrier-protein] synthase II
VVITGLGAVHPHGIGAGPLAEALAAGRPALTPLDPFPGVPIGPRGGAGAVAGAALAVDPPLGRGLPPLASRRMSPQSKLTVAAARLALEDAGAELPAEPDPGTAVVLATAFGAASFTERLLDQVLDEGPESMSPFLFTECVANAAAAQVAIHCRATGPNLTICQREAGALTALGRGAGEVARGAARRALVGAVEEITPLLHSVLGAFGALAAARDGVPAAARPFDRRRNGVIAASGAAVLLVETDEAAAARGARPLARVRAWGGGFDATASRSGWGVGERPLAAALGRVLERAGLGPEDVDLVVSGAAGSVAGDRLEALILRRVWGERPLPPVVAPKGVTGEYAGGHLAAAVLAAGGRGIGPTAGFAEPDPELGLVPHDGSPLPPPRRILAGSLAAGGPAAWVILEAP